MGKLLIAIYDFFARRRVLFFGITIGLFVFFAYCASKVHIEEDITRVLPNDEKVEKLNFVFRNSRFSEKIIIRVAQADTSKSAEPEKLIAYADQFIALADSQLKPYIHDSRYKVEDNAIFSTYNTIHQNLPIYLTDDDYAAIDTLIATEKLSRTLDTDYQLITSPSGLLMKRIVSDDPTGMSARVLQRIQALTVNENFDLYDGYIMTKDHKSLVMFITPNTPGTETNKNGLLVDALDNVIGKLKSPDIRTVYFGGPVVAVGNARQLRKDSQYTFGVTVTILVVFIGLFFRRKRVPFIMVLPVLFGTLFAMTVVWLHKGEISSIALAAGSVILGVAIDYSLHFFSHFRHSRNIRETITDLFQPLTIGSITTMGSFFGLLFVNSEILNDFGLFAGCSLLGASVFTLIFLPHFFPTSVEQEKERKDSFPWFDKMVNYRTKHTWVFVLIIVALTIFFAQYINKVGFESDMLKLNFMTDELRQTQDEINALREGNTKSVYVVSTGKNLDEALQNSTKLTGKANQLQAAGDIKTYLSAGTFIVPKTIQQQRIDKWNNYWTYAKKEQLKKTLVAEGAKYKFRETAFQNFFNLLDKEYIVQGPETFSELRDNFVNDYLIESKDRAAVITELKVPRAKEAEVKAAFNQSEDWFVLDRSVIASKFVQFISNDFNKILAITAILVLVMLLVSYGSIELTLITFLPMVVVWIWVLGIMGLMGIQFNIINIIVSTFVFGLGDDYSIFIMDGLQSEYKYGKNTLASHKESIILSAITTILGFGALIFAKHPALHSIALIAIIGLFCILVVSQILIPFLFRAFMLNRKYKHQPPYVWYTFLYSIFDFLYYVVGSFILTIVGYILIYLIPIPKKTKKAILHFMLKWLMWGLVYVSLYVRKRYINRELADFSKPAIIICNHQSFLDILVTVMQNPKVLLMTNDWVWNSPVFGKVVQLAEYYPVANGVENSVDILGEKIREGYSIVIFPEGTRSLDSRMKRFHKGAFFLAEKLNVDIQPLVLHGIGDTMRKNDFQLMPGTMTFKYLPRIAPDDKTFGEGYSERAKNIGKYYRAEYEKLRVEFETPKYHYNRLISNYLYKGPVLEWYTRVKVKLEDYYNLYHNTVPRNCTILNIGCGYGYMDYMLYLCANDRKITGVDYDAEKVEVANNCWLRNEHVNFVHADITTYDFGNHDVFIINDTLHYIPYQAQEALLEKCFSKLNDGGMILIKDANTKNEKKQRFTWLTEFFSTNFGFNKTAHATLFFPDEEFITGIARKHGMVITKLEESKVTSNTMYLIKKG